MDIWLFCGMLDCPSRSPSLFCSAYAHSFLWTDRSTMITTALWAENIDEERPEAWRDVSMLINCLISVNWYCTHAMRQSNPRTYRLNFPYFCLLLAVWLLPNILGYPKRALDSNKNAEIFRCDENDTQLKTLGQWNVMLSAPSSKHSKILHFAWYSSHEVLSWNLIHRYHNHNISTLWKFEKCIRVDNFDYRSSKCIRSVELYSLRSGYLTLRRMEGKMRVLETCSGHDL